MFDLKKVNNTFISTTNLTMDSGSLIDVGSYFKLFGEDLNISRISLSKNLINDDPVSENENTCAEIVADKALRLLDKGYIQCDFPSLISKGDIIIEGDIRPSKKFSTCQEDDSPVLSFIFSSRDTGSDRLDEPSLIRNVKEFNGLDANVSLTL